MPKTKSYAQRESWFVAIDILLFLVLALFILSMFVWDSDKSLAGNPSAETLKMLIEVDEPYFKDLYDQEGKGSPVRVRFASEVDAFGTVEWIKGNVYLLRCDSSYVVQSKYHQNVWELYNTRILYGTILSLHSELADFSAAVISSPSLAYPDTSWLTETPATTEKAETDDGTDSSTTESTDSGSSEIEGK